MEKEKDIPLVKPDPLSGKDGVKLTLQPMHDEKKEGEVTLTPDESTRMDDLPLSEEQKAKEAEALAKVLLMQEESEKDKRFPGLIMPWRLSIAVLLIILFFVILHFAFALFAPRGAISTGRGGEFSGALEKVQK